MNSSTNTKAEGLKSKQKKGRSPLPAEEKNSGLNPTLPFVEPSKDPDADEETVSIKIRIGDTISKDNKTKYDTNRFKVIETFSYSSAAVVDMLRAIDLEIFTPYSLKGLLFTKKRLGIFLRVLKGTEKTQFKEATRD